jgi:signal transduction histidine kinase
VRELLRSVWAEPRPPDVPRRNRRDWLLVAVAAVAVTAEGLLRTDLQSPVAATLVTLALLPTLLWRRTRPLPTVAVAFAGTGAAAFALGHEIALVSGAVVLFLPWALFRWGSGRDRVLGAAVILVKIGLSAVAGPTPAADAVAGSVVMFGVFALATAVRYRATLRSRELERVRLLERERLARDLHDTVAHHVSAMAIRAQAGIAVAQTRPEGAVDALHVIESEATRALAEMRSMVRTLRDTEPAELAPSPGIPDIRRLAQGSAGPVVDVELTGDLDDLPPPLGAAIYRLAQESVTNARRHARHATRIEVRVAADAGAVRLRVSDDGDPATPRPGGGFGLAGMAERAGLLGGTCEAGPGPVRGWTVTAALPRPAL